LDVTEIAHFQLKREDLAAIDMSVACYLVLHPKGTLAWEAGAVPDSAFTAGTPAKLHTATSTKTLTSQLTAIGYPPGSISYFAVSHFHWDHVANSNLFTGATVLSTKVEHEVMFGDSPFAQQVRARPRSDPTVYAALKNSKTVTYEGDYDVFGDGTVVLKAAPGHSPGHQVLYVKLARTGPVLLSVDLYHYPEQRARKLVPTTDYNVQQTAASRAAVEAFLQNAGAVLWIQHDLTGNAKLKKSPEFYD